MRRHLGLSIKNIKENDFRSFLTIIGILIGITAIVALVSLTQGLAEAVERELDDVGADMITVSAGTHSIGTELDIDNIEHIEGVRGVKEVTPTLLNFAEVEYRGDTESVFIFGIKPEIFDIAPPFNLKEGRLHREHEEGVGIAGKEFSNDVFDETLGLRDNVILRDQRIRIIGIREYFGIPLHDRSLSLPLKDAQEIFDKEDKFSQAFVEVSDNYDPSQVADEIDQVLNEETDEEIMVETMEQILDAVNNVLAMVQALFVGVASIALLVGGVGIMSTMYTSVLEKQRDIGIMKAVGARNSDIMKIFLFESGLLGLLGGLLGVLIGFSIAKVIERIMHNFMGVFRLQASFDPLIIVSVLIFSVLIGTLSGVLPARRAAGLNPVDSLRS